MSPHDHVDLVVAETVDEMIRNNDERPLLDRDESELEPDPEPADER